MTNEPPRQASIPEELPHSSQSSAASSPINCYSPSGPIKHESHKSSQNLQTSSNPLQVSGAIKRNDGRNNGRLAGGAEVALDKAAMTGEYVLGDDV